MNETRCCHPKLENPNPNHICIFTNIKIYNYMKVINATYIY